MDATFRVDENTVVKLLATAIEHGASDLHLNVGVPPSVRLNTRIVRLEGISPLTADDLSTLKKYIVLSDAHQLALENTGVVDLVYPLEHGKYKARFRVNVIKTRMGLKITMRRLPNKIIKLHDLGLPDQYKRLILKKKGLILVTGPTGSGKTTTLASTTSHLAELGNRHIIMIEHPTEYVIGHGKGLVTQREVTLDTPEFAAGVHDALREDPDIIIVGEMRSRETMEAAMHAAETGHLVFGTLHTTGAAASVDRIVNQFPVDQHSAIRSMLSINLAAVISQQLLPTADEKGMVMAYEFMKVNPAIAHLIRTGDSHRITSSIQTGRKHGMRLFDDHLKDLVVAGTVTQQAAMEFALDPENLAVAISRSLQNRRSDEDEEGDDDET